MPCNRCVATFDEVVELTEFVMRHGKANKQSQADSLNNLNSAGLVIPTEL